MKAAPFYPIIKDRREDLVDTVLKRLKASDSANYRKVNAQLLRARIEKLVDAFLLSAKGEPGPFVSYIEKLTEERIAEGYYLAEIQLVLSILEEQAWDAAVQTSSIGSLVPHLGLITTTVGLAKDRLAQIFLEHKQRAETNAAALERKLEALFKGTEAPDL